MKRIMAIKKPFRLDDAREALSGIGVSSITVSDAKGFGRQLGQCEIYTGAEYTGDFMPKVMLEVVVSDTHVAQTAETIQCAAQTGLIGDGKIFVSSVERVIRIRTGECDDAALL